MQNEKWRAITGLEGVAEVSNLGRVRTLDRKCPVPARTRNGKTQAPAFQWRKGCVIAPVTSREGYAAVSFAHAGIRYRFYAHRLVGLAFVPGYFEGASIDHLDRNKLNNRADNLEWVTLAENTRRQWASGLIDYRGAANPSAKLTKEQAAAIKLLADNGFPYRLLAEWFEVSTGTVDNIKGGRGWREALAA